MNRARLAAVLDQMHWSQTSLSALTGYSVRTIGRWETVPEPVAEWLESVAGFLRSHPAPVSNHHRPRSRRAA